MKNIFKISLLTLVLVGVNGLQAATSYGDQQMSEQDWTGASSMADTNYANDMKKKWNDYINKEKTTGTSNWATPSAADSYTNTNQYNPSASTMNPTDTNQ